MEKYHKFKICSFFSQVLLIGTLGPHPLTQASEAPPFIPKKGWVGSQFGRGDRHCGTLCIWVLCARNSLLTIFYAVKHKIGNFERFFKGAKNCPERRPPGKTPRNRRFCVLLHKKWFETNSEHLYLPRNGSEQNY